MKTYLIPEVVPPMTIPAEEPPMVLKRRAGVFKVEANREYLWPTGHELHRCQYTNKYINIEMRAFWLNPNRKIQSMRL